MPKMELAWLTPTWTPRGGLNGLKPAAFDEYFFFIGQGLSNAALRARNFQVGPIIFN